MRILRENEAGTGGGGQPSKEQQFDDILSQMNSGTPAAPVKKDDTPPPPPPSEEGGVDYKAKFEQLSAEYEPIKGKVAELDNLRALAEADPFDGDVELKAIKELKAKGASTDTALQYLRMDLKTMTPFDKKVLSMQLSTPNVSKDKLEKYVREQYKLGEYAPKQDDGETPDESDGLTKLEIEVATKGGVDEQLAQQKEELLTQAGKPRSEVKLEQEQKAASASLEADWNKEAPTILNTLKGFAVKVEGVENPIKIELDGYDEAKVKEYLDRVVKGGHNLTEDNVKYVREQVMKDAYYDNREKIALKIAQATSGKLEKESVQELNNPSVFTPKPGDGVIKKTKQEELDYALKNLQ